MNRQGKAKGTKATAAKDLSVRRSKGRAVKGGEINNPMKS
jgi:hypothetical protein